MFSNSSFHIQINPTEAPSEATNSIFIKLTPGRKSAPATLEFAMVAATVSSGRPDVYYMARIALGCNTLAADYTTLPAA